MRSIATIVGPFFFNSFEDWAHNAVEVCLRDDLPTATYWEKPRNFGHQRPIVVQNPSKRGIIDFSQKVTVV